MMAHQPWIHYQAGCAWIGKTLKAASKFSQIEQKELTAWQSHPRGLAPKVSRLKLFIYYK